MMHLHKESSFKMMSEERNKHLKHIFFNTNVNLSKLRQDLNTEAIRLGSLGQDKAKNKA